MMCRPTALWILISTLICQETQADDILTKVGNTVKLPCNTTFDEPVDWRYQKDATIDEDYVCTASNQGVTRCDHYFKWPRIDVNVSTLADYTLTIHNASVNDSGLYHCVEQVGAGTRHTFKLNFTLLDSDIDECWSNPCQNNGTCIDGLNSYHCNCSEKTTGDDCEIERRRTQKTNPIIVVAVVVPLSIIIVVIVAFVFDREHRTVER